MRALVLRASGRKRPKSLFEVNFLPTHPDDFAAPRSCQNEKPDNVLKRPAERVRGLQIRRNSRSSSTRSRGVSADRAITPSQGEAAMISRETAHRQNLRKIARTRFAAIGAPRSTTSSNNRFTSRREMLDSGRPPHRPTISLFRSRMYSCAVEGLFVRRTCFSINPATTTSTEPRTASLAAIFLAAFSPCGSLPAAIAARALAASLRASPRPISAGPSVNFRGLPECR